MDRIRRILKEIVAPAAILTLAILASTLSGCATVETQHITITDPTHLRVLLKNESPYKIKLEGAKTGWLGPRESIVFHTECRGKFDGVAHAYKIIGRTEFGGDVSSYMGERTFSFRTDGYNQMYYGESYDTVIVISSFYLYRNIPFGAEKTHYPLYTGPCGLMDLQFQWGK